MTVMVMKARTLNGTRAILPAQDVMCAIPSGPNAPDEILSDPARSVDEFQRVRSAYARELEPALDCDGVIRRLRSSCLPGGFRDCADIVPAGSFWADAAEPTRWIGTMFAVGASHRRMRDFAPGSYERRDLTKSDYENSRVPDCRAGLRPHARRGFAR